MKTLLLIATALLFSGCATRDQLYYDAAKSISRDNTVSQSACWAAVTELGKNADSTVRIAAIALAERCKNSGSQLQQPQRNLLGL